MQRKGEVVKGGAPINRIRENSRLMQTHESMVDFINGRHPRSSFLDILTSSLFGFRPSLDDDIIYSDDDDDYDDDHFHPHNVIHRPLEPHPRIRQLTDEEADKHAKELIEEEERRKEKTERNKRKKMRKKEKKRLEKENKVKEVLPVEEQGKSDSSENQEENSVIENDAKANESPKSVKTQNTAVAVKCDGSSDNIKEEEEVLQMNMKEEEEENQTDLQLNNSFACLAISVPEETSNERPARDRKKKKNKLVEDQQTKEEKPTAVEKAEGQKKEETNEPNKETPVDPTAEEFAIRSRELAGIGNRLAASGQFEMAVKYFTDAIKYNPKEFKLFGNRSLCFERINQYENALSDADIALCMQPNWIKGLFRKGKALCGLKRYYEASLIYKEVLQLESTSAEAMQELKRAQTLHLMEMGFSWEQSSKALKTHATLEEAVEALFAGDRDLRPEDVGAGVNAQVQHVVQEQDANNNDGGEWVVLQTSRPRMQQIKESDAFSQSRSKSQSPTPHARNSGKPELFPIWVGSLAPAVTYSTLHEVFSRAGTVYSIKMLLEHQCAFVNYTKKEDCDRAIQCINGMVVEGAPLTVRYPNRIHTGLGVSKSAATDPFLRSVPYKKECFFWRTTGCTRSDCTYKHVPEHKNIDKDKFTGRLGNFNM